MRTFTTITFGCRVNSAQTQEIEEELREKGWWQVEKAENPDIFIINSCCVTQKAEREVKKMVRSVLRNFPGAEIYLTGCLTKLSGFEKFSSPRVKYELNLGEKRRRPDKIGASRDDKPLNKLLRSGRAFVKIQEGCDNRCSYCVVPYVRKRLCSKPIKEIVAEILRRDKEGMTEIIITGTNLGKYKYGLTNLLEEILKKTAIPLISFGSINYEAINEDMGKFIRVCRSPRITKHFHIPLQSGSEKILKLMRRPYTIDGFQKTLDRLEKAFPGITFGTDIIAGFPGEEKEDFRATVDFIKKNRFLKLHVFRFSKRPGTLAGEKESFWGKVDEAAKKSRARILREMATGKEKAVV